MPEAPAWGPPRARPPALGPGVTHGPAGSAASPGLCAAFGPGRRSSRAGRQHHPLPGPPGGRSRGGRWALGCPASVGRGPATRRQTRGPEPRAAGLKIPRLLQTRPISAAGAYPRTLAAWVSLVPQLVPGQRGLSQASSSQLLASLVSWMPGALVIQVLHPP